MNKKQSEEGKDLELKKNGEVLVSDMHTCFQRGISALKATYAHFEYMLHFTQPISCNSMWDDGSALQLSKEGMASAYLFWDGLVDMISICRDDL